MSFIYHLTSPEAWEKALDKGTYQADSLESEGFIHCSTKAQVIPSADKHFSHAQELIVLAIVDKRVKSHLRWEPSREGELFPHIYHPISLDMVETTYMLSRNNAGKWEWIM